MEEFLQAFVTSKIGGIIISSLMIAGPSYLLVNGGRKKVTNSKSIGHETFQASQEGLGDMMTAAGYFLLFGLYPLAICGILTS